MIIGVVALYQVDRSTDGGISDSHSSNPVTFVRYFGSAYKNVRVVKYFKALLFLQRVISQNSTP